MTARCTANNTWGPLDMSQCTFTNDISVVAVAVVEVQSLVEDPILEMDVSGELISDKIECTVYVNAIASNIYKVQYHVVTYICNVQGIFPIVIYNI